MKVINFLTDISPFFWGFEMDGEFFVYGGRVGFRVGVFVVVFRLAL